MNGEYRKANNRVGKTLKIEDYESKERDLHQKS